MAVEVASAAPCQASSLMRVSTRRCDSIANAISRRNAASTLTSWARSGIPTSALHQEMRQHAEHREQEGGGQELRRQKQAQLREQRLDQRESRAGERELPRERRKAVRQRRQVAGVGDAPGAEQANADSHVGEELDRDRPLDQRQMPRRGLQDQGLVNPGEL